ncbi:MAG: NAD+ synthetase, partial [Clostridia bacterium]|nr:NAD+ synthetase [Clostridia bacterium]
MSRVRVAGATVNQTPLDWSNNLANIVRAIEVARNEGATIVCLPELCITGYGCEDAFLSPGVHKTALEVLMECLPHTKGMIVSLGLPLFHRCAVFNSACLVADGEILGFVPKKFLASEGLHYEPRWFKPWPAGVCDQIEIAGRNYPIGD